MSTGRRIATALAAVGAMVAVVVGVPAVLIGLVGNPWPGRTRIELRDDVALVVGLLAVLAWIVWARFVIAVVVEVRDQLAELRLSATAEQRAPVELTAPVDPRQGVGLLAQRLVAAALLLMPIAIRASSGVAESAAPLRPSRAVAAVVATTEPTIQPTASPSPPPPRARADVGTVTVAPGDTLIGLARSRLGDADRWREIFELNKDRLQPDGGRLLSPSAIRAGWTLVLPAAATAPAETAPAEVDAQVDAQVDVTSLATTTVLDVAGYSPPATVVVELDDNLWELSEEHLAEAGAPHDDVSVAVYLDAVIAANRDVVEDPALIYVGEEIDLPGIGTPLPPPAEPVVAAPAPVPLPPPMVPAPRAPNIVSPLPTDAPTVTAPPAPATAPTTTTTTVSAAAAPADAPVGATTSVPGPPAPIGIGEATLLSAGVLALLTSRRRVRLRSSTPRARVPEAPPEAVATERRLRTVDAGERLLRVDVAVRAAAASLIEGPAQIAVIRVGPDGAVELTLTSEGSLPAPWHVDGGWWVLPGSTPIELLAEAARSVGAPCVALTQLGVDDDGREVLVDLEALRVLSVAAPDELADAVVRGVAATLATSVFAEVANLVGVAIEDTSFLDHRQAHHADFVDAAVELAATLVGTTSLVKQSTFVLRARHTSGEAWEPAVVLTGSSALGEVTPEMVRATTRGRGGVAMVVAGDAPGAPWSLRAEAGRWTLHPLGIALTPVGLSSRELDEIHDVLQRADMPLVTDEPAPDGAELAPISTRSSLDVPARGDADDFQEPAWSLLVRVLGQVEVVDAMDQPVRFERSKTLELIAWLTLHRECSTRAGARTALWELDVRDATFANVVSEARRAMARLVDPPAGEEWLGRTLTDVLPLHDAVVADVDLVRMRLDHARLQPPEQAIETLRPAVELIRDLPFAGTGYLWPDAEGTTSNLVLLATSAASELAGHFLSMGDIDGVFWATGRGLRVLAGHEELIALRMRAHARAGDLSGVRLEWESYERVLNADLWSDGEPAPKLVMLRRELLSS